tara:strand:+ start:467 stop:676 length:210 start_codon:yes stop_codon:yes gene_type:complete
MTAVRVVEMQSDDGEFFAIEKEAAQELWVRVTHLPTFSAESAAILCAKQYKRSLTIKNSLKLLRVVEVV